MPFPQSPSSFVGSGSGSPLNLNGTVGSDGPRQYTAGYISTTSHHNKELNQTMNNNNNNTSDQDDWVSSPIHSNRIRNGSNNPNGSNSNKSPYRGSGGGLFAFKEFVSHLHILFLIDSLVLILSLSELSFFFLSQFNPAQIIAYSKRINDQMEDDGPPKESLLDQDSSSHSKPTRSDLIGHRSLASSLSTQLTQPGQQNRHVEENRTNHKDTIIGHKVQVFGFTPSQQSFVIEHFSAIGELICPPELSIEGGNWATLTYKHNSAAQRAVRKNGEIIGGIIMIGSKFVSSSDSSSSHDPHWDTTPQDNSKTSSTLPKSGSMIVSRSLKTYASTEAFATPNHPSTDKGILGLISNAGKPDPSIFANHHNSDHELQNPKDSNQNPSYVTRALDLVFGCNRPNENPNEFHKIVTLYWVSVIIELLSEPAYINLTLRGETGRRVRVEGVAVTVKTIGTISVVYLGSYWGYDAGLLGFAIGQLTYSLSLCIGFWSTLFHCSSERNLYPRQVDNSSLSIGLDSWIHAADYSLCWALTRQSIIKQFLTEGDKLIVSKICPIANQGAYALAMNYGSLVARILFQPIEETSRLYFSKNLSLPSSQSPTTTKETRESTVDHTSKEESERAKGAIDLLKNLLKAQIYLGLIFITFGPPYVRIVTRLLLGRRSGYLKEGSSSTIVEVLSAYCHLIPLLGLNGIIEGFVQSTALESDLNKLSKLMGLWCLIFIGSVSLFNSPFISTQFSISAEVAIVMATCINMICRIGYGSWYIIHYFRSKYPLIPANSLKILPSSFTFIAFVGAAYATRSSLSHPSSSSHILRKDSADDPLFSYATIIHLRTGITCLFGCLLVIMISERSRIKEFLRRFKSRTKSD
ncbi:hypothetical protein PSHT_02206 [Puccinia striiformis]|uniref:Man(5)GlcNAc(2)-PP-dolichol translocation protein RFT1 n=1 Tax=Puccinia striiformis TaxID=27350 RepID=A0A2S4WIS8_9BASI|nr:hypothetical protein PSHT_02206 [Puccinia striiformis]